MTRAVPRGIANDNGGNVLWDGKTKWIGMRPVQTDPEMVQCIAPEYGLRIVIIIARAYFARGITTIGAVPQSNGKDPRPGFIQTYCPPKHRLPNGKVVPNNTAAYEKFVCGKMGLPATAQLQLGSRPFLRKFLAAIVEQENGIQPYGPEIFDRAMDLASVPKEQAK